MFEDSPKIGADWLPVTVTRADGLVTLPEARAIVTVPDETGEGRLLVWTVPNGPALDTAWTREGSDLAGSTRWEFAATDGLRWVVTKERGCGCSSPLKTMPLPWSSYRMGALR